MSFSTPARGAPFRIYGKALQILKQKSSRQPTMKIWWF